MKRTPESHVLRAVQDIFAAERILCFRMNSGAIRDQTGRPVRFGVPGMADLLAFPIGRPLWVECKAAKGKQSDAQKKFQELVEAHGMPYLLAYSPDDLIVYLRKAA